MIEHGYVIAGKNIPNVLEGTKGIITAYLPDMETYAVYWEKVILGTVYWHTYKEKDEQTFRNRFSTVVLYEEASK